MINIQKRKKYPIVIMTSEGDDQLAVESLKSGAFDYVVKSQETFNQLPGIVEKAHLEWTHVNQKRISGEKIKKQNRELKKINAELDRFVYSARHELRAPLMSVLGLINLSKTEEKEEVKQEYLSLMEDSIKRLDKYIKDITDYSKNNRLEPVIHLVDAQGVVDNSLISLAYMPNFSKIRKEITISGSYEAYTDSGRLEVILSNLISNAIKYHNYYQSDPFIHVEVSIRRTKIVVNVIDNGCGISAQRIDKVFDMFYRATENSVGSGLGLYITKEIVEKMKGTINIRSFLKAGTRVTVVLPNRKPRPKK